MGVEASHLAYGKRMHLFSVYHVHQQLSIHSDSNSLITSESVSRRDVEVGRYVLRSFPTQVLVETLSHRLDQILDR